MRYDNRGKFEKMKDSWKTVSYNIVIYILDSDFPKLIYGKNSCCMGENFQPFIHIDWIHLTKALTLAFKTK